MIVKLKTEDITFNRKIQDFCKLKYTQHSEGCLNYSKNTGIPPGIPLIDEILDLSKPVYLIYTEFYIREHARKMKKMPLEWTDRQIYCLFYWQPKARKMHKREVERVQIKKGS
jgi:predicted metal-binding protein